MQVTTGKVNRSEWKNRYYLKVTFPFTYLLPKKPLFTSPSPAGITKRQQKSTRGQTAMIDCAMPLEPMFQITWQSPYQIIATLETASLQTISERRAHFVQICVKGSAVQWVEATKTTDGDVQLRRGPIIYYVMLL